VNAPLSLLGKKEEHRKAKSQVADDGADGGHRENPMVALGKAIFDKNEKELRKLQPILREINSFDFSQSSDDELKQRSEQLKRRLTEQVAQRLTERGFDSSRHVDEWLAEESDDEYLRARRAAEEDTLNELLPEAFALVREVAARTVQLRPFDVQCLGGVALHQGKIAEMKTGEGKTLTATMPVYLNALTGRGVHLVTVNDYLAERDANWMRPIYEFLGLKVAFIRNDSTSAERKAAYNSDVLYITNSEVGFDYLRDNMASTRRQLVQRPLNYAIVDEVDNILIDEARTPLIISAQVELTQRAAMRRHYAKLCDGVARKLINREHPAVTDQEVKKLIDQHTSDNRIAIDALYQIFQDNGCIEEALDYLVDCYLAAPGTPRAHHVGKLVDALEELERRDLLEPAAMSDLSQLIGELPAQETVVNRIVEESRRRLAPHLNLAAWVNNATGELESWDATHVRAMMDFVEKSGVVRAEALHDLERQLDHATDTENARRTLLESIFREAEERRLVSEEGERHLLGITLDRAPSEELEDVLTGSVLPRAPLTAQALTMAQEQFPAKTENADPRDAARKLSSLIEQLGVRDLLPPDSVERLWDLAKIHVSHDELRRTILTAGREKAGPELKRIASCVQEFAQERDAWLQQHSDELAASLQSIEGIPKNAVTDLDRLARSGVPEPQLLNALREMLMLVAPNSDVLRCTRNFIAERRRHAEQQAATLVLEVSEWIKVPKELRRRITTAFAEHSEPNSLRDQLSELVRDLSGEVTEIPALINEALSNTAQWNRENVGGFLDGIAAAAPFSNEALNELSNSVEQGAAAQVIERLISDRLFDLDVNRETVEHVRSFSQAWCAWKQVQGDALNEECGDIGSEDLLEKIRRVTSEPLVATQLPARVVELVIEDLIGRNLEPLLAQENATVFMEEVRRRFPLSKDIRNKLKSEQFADRNRDQLKGQVHRLVQQTLGSITIEDLPRTVKNLGWYVEKDEKQRASALTDMGALIAEREISRPSFPDPEGFAEILMESDVLREDEYQYLTMLSAGSQGETGRGSGQGIGHLIGSHLQLDPARQRKLGELKMGEVGSILDQAIKAHAIFHRDVHYVVQDGREIAIVDEFTGRLMPGRRWSDGLHEAVEAKHGVEVRLESQTVATITIQNYFRIYYKLAGMTGTARTEEGEFINTYKLEVVSVPTNQPIRRADSPDVVYKTSESKFRAITLELLQMHWRGQPVLVGTRSVEVSERLSDRLKGPALQLLALTVLIKEKLWAMGKQETARRDELLRQLNLPLVQLNVAQVRGVAKEMGVSPDVTSKENIDKLESMLEDGPGSRDRLVTALKNGIPHNVLNAKNHRNEARVIAEAARIGSITIATNMAGRGVDIVLGGTLDNEARIRVVTGQIIARRVRGEFARVKSRTDETTGHLLQRLQSGPLQDLCWCVSAEESVRELHQNGTIDSFQAKELRDALASPLDGKEVRNRVRSRARRMNCAEVLPLDDDSLTSERLEALAKRVGLSANATESLRSSISDGVPAYVYHNEAPEHILVRILLRFVDEEKCSFQRMVQALPELRDLDRLLLETVSSENASTQDSSSMLRVTDRMSRHPDVAGITLDWVRHRLEAFDAVDAAAARRKMESLSTDEIEVNDHQILHLITSDSPHGAPSGGEGAVDIQWIHERLRSLGIIASERRHISTGFEGAGEGVVNHYRFRRDALNSVSFDPTRFESTVRGDQIVDALRDLDPQSPWSNLEWVDNRMWGMKIIQGPQEVRTIALPATGEQNTIRETTIYRIIGKRLLDLMEQPLFEALIHYLGDESEIVASGEDIARELLTQQPLLEDWITVDWILKRLNDWKIIDTTDSSRGGDNSFRVERRKLPTVLLESGVSGQSADWVLVGAPRPEDVVQTSEYHDVKALRGLHVLGTERHESRRIDNQLRGRSGRQGDPGSSRFFVSWEDELIRLFATPPKFLLDRWYEDEAIEAKLVSKSIERAQKKVEINHFEARKHTLQYDDVMNIQRDVIYKERRKALLGGNLRKRILEMIEKSVAAEVSRNANPQLPPADWDLERLLHNLNRLMGICRLSDYLDEDEAYRLSYVDLVEHCVDAFRRAYDDREKEFTEPAMREIERLKICEVIDEYWMEHLAEMDSLREGINLRAYGQREPILEYRREAYELFGSMMESIHRDMTEYLFRLPVEVVREFMEEQSRHHLRLRSVQMRRGADQALAAAAAGNVGEFQGPIVTYEHAGRKVGRNEPCPCGSGKKYKNCCMAKQMVA